MKMLIILILATIYGSLAVIIVAAIAHDLLVRGRSRRRDLHPQRVPAEERSDRGRVPLDDADNRFPLDDADSRIPRDDAESLIALDDAESLIALDDAESLIALDDAESLIALDDAEVKTARSQARPPD